MTSRRSWLLAAAALVAARVAPARAGADAAWAAVVDRVAYQRALSQRVTKAYLMLAMDVEPALARRMLDEGSATFERHLTGLLAAPPSADAARQLALLAEGWADCRRHLQRPPDRAGADELYRASEALQERAHQVVLAYERLRPSQALRGVVHGGRLRMLSERMAKYWLYKRWGLHAQPADMELHLARAHFKALMRQMDRLGPGPAGGAALAQVRGRWADYDAALFADRAVPATELVVHSERNLGAVQALVDDIVALAGRPAVSAPAR